MNRKELVVGALYKRGYRRDPMLYVGEIKEKVVAGWGGTYITKKHLVFATPRDWRAPLQVWEWEPCRVARADRIAPLEVSLQSWKDGVLAESGEGRLSTLLGNAKVLRIESRLLLSGRTTLVSSSYFQPVESRLIEASLVSPSMCTVQPSKKSGVDSAVWSYSRHSRTPLATLTLQVAPRAIKRVAELLALLGDAEEEAAKW